jgi:hypothetical protein
MQRLELRAHLFEGQLALYVTRKDGFRFVAGLESFQLHRGQSLPHVVEPIRTGSIGDTEGQRHE